MGDVLAKVIRVVKSYNIETRALKSIGEGRKVVPPKHPSSLHGIEQIKTEYSDKYHDLIRKHETLEKNLKDVFVKSSEIPQSIPRVEENLPKRTTFKSPFEYGFEDPEEVPPGRYTLTQIIQIICDHNANPKINTIESLAAKYSLDPKHLSSIFKFYRLFRVVPDDSITNKSKPKAISWSKGSVEELKNIRKLPGGSKKGS